MRVVSLVPSITETLLNCNVEVVGRTRYCIHPPDKTQAILTVGGTKDLNSDKLKSLNPDLLILDKEENNKWMSENAPCEVLISHVTSITSLCEFLKILSDKLKNKELNNIYNRWEKVRLAPAKIWDWDHVPGQILSWSDSSLQTALSNRNVNKNTHLHYLIWKNPWMSVAKQTFIGDVLQKLGANDFLVDHHENYPKIDDSLVKSQNSICLFSSEPYPFEKYKPQLAEWAPHGALVNGELYSWFGIRSLLFLEKELGLKSS